MMLHPAEGAGLARAALALGSTLESSSQCWPGEWSLNDASAVPGLVSNRVAPGYSSCCTLPVKVPVCDPCTHLAAPLDPHGAAFPVDPLSGHLQTFATCQTRDRVTPDIEILSILLQS